MNLTISKQNILSKYWDEKPLVLILIAAVFFRLIAVIFSKGYGMHDDHFLVIEAAQSWVDGADYNNWLPSASNPNVQPSGHSLLYPGLHYLLFRMLELFGMSEPQSKMYIVRLLHAIYSMSIVYLGYKIAYRCSGIKAAKISGGLLAILFFMPMMSVRNLVEFVCIPPLLYATWLTIKNSESKSNAPFIVIGILLSLAFSIRFQTTLFIAGFGLVFVLQQKWKQAFLVTLGIAIGLVAVQASTDMVIWGKPFMEFKEYIRYNIVAANEYGKMAWYNYLLLIGGICIPPISLFLLFGYVRSWKKHLLLFLPAFIFLVFHSSFPNKQERFILPVIPFIIILGSIGWCDYMIKSNYWQNHLKLYRGCWIFFFSLNTIPLLFVSGAYSHRNRVESMVYLSTKKDLNNFIIEESNNESYTMPPKFYVKNWKNEFSVTSLQTVDSLALKMKTTSADMLPNYVVFNKPENINQRVDNFKKHFPNLVYETTIEPGFIDEVMHFLNKRNANFTSYIYKIEKQ